MVFSGSSADPGPYAENHVPASGSELTWYGASKAFGERAAVAQNPESAVVRIIYPVRGSFPQKLDYVRKILNLYDEGKLYPMFSDQQINITYIDELAMALAVLLGKQPSGFYHVASSDTTTPYDLATYLLKTVRGVDKVVVKSSLVTFVQSKDPRRYPRFGGLKSRMTQEQLKLKFSIWKDIVDKLAPGLQIL
jgi:dTDP-4-dehydrorhamnose reductase